MTATEIQNSANDVTDFYNKEVLSAFSRANEGMQKVFDRRRREYVSYFSRIDKMKAHIRGRKLRRK